MRPRPFTACSATLQICPPIRCAPCRLAHHPTQPICQHSPPKPLRPATPTWRQARHHQHVVGRHPPLLACHLRRAAVGCGVRHALRCCRPGKKGLRTDKHVQGLADKVSMSEGHPERPCVPCGRVGAGGRGSTGAPADNCRFFYLSHLLRRCSVVSSLAEARNAYPSTAQHDTCTTRFRVLVQTYAARASSHQMQTGRTTRTQGNGCAVHGQGSPRSLTRVLSCCWMRSRVRWSSLASPLTYTNTSCVAAAAVR